MILNRLVLPVLALFLGGAGLATANASGLAAASPAAGYGQERGAWDAPPQEWQEVQRRGFRDGIEGAHKDFDNHRRPDVNNRDEYRSPSVPWQMREKYREGFRRGYERGMAHLMGGPAQPMRPPEPQMHEPERGRDMDQERGSEIQRRGFQDGMDGARKDYDNHRRPDPNNRDEYRRPNVPDQLQREYREAFRRGYQQAMTQLTGGHDRH